MKTIYRTSTKEATKKTVCSAARSSTKTKLTQWMLGNQIGVSFSLITLLFLANFSIPAARLFTSKFFNLSYYNLNTGKYAAGHDDIYFLAFCIVLFTGLRASLMEYILAPLARLWGVKKKKDVTRFSEQGWILTYYLLFCPLGMYIYYKSPYFLSMKGLWTNWPQRELDGLMKVYILAQWSYCIQEVFVINIEHRRKDHWQMLTHHFVTIALIFASYAYHQTRVGSVILALMDVIDVFLPLAKCLKYLGFTTLCDIVFGIFILSWFITRHVLYLMICWSIWSDLPLLIKQACYSGPADHLQGPFPVPESGWSHLLSPFRESDGTVCWNSNIMLGFLIYLLFLQVLMAMWFFLIMRVAMKVIRGNSAEDVRSDSEEEVEEIDTQPFEEEVGVESIDFTAWERRNGVKASTTSSRHIIDRKELLNRIGCEKQID